MVRRKLARPEVADERVLSMADRVLRCRGLGHTFKVRPTSRQRLMDLAAEGCKEIAEQCVTGGDGCGLTRVKIYARSTGELLHRSGDYGDGYLVKGGGRVDRNDARAEWFARDDAGLYRVR